LSTSHDDRRPHRLAHLDVSWMAPADLCTVDALARLQLVAVQRGRSLEIHGADRRLVGLLELVGLAEAVQVCHRCRVPASGSDGRGGGKPEDAEQRRVEESVDGANAPASDVEHVEGGGGGWFTGCPRSIDRIPH
jgi:hypothetical protein